MTRPCTDPQQLYNEKVWSSGFLEKKDDNSEEVGEVPRQPEDVHCAALSKQTSPIILQQKRDRWLDSLMKRRMTKLVRYGTLSSSVEDPDSRVPRIRISNQDPDSRREKMTHKNRKKS
jgi:hypothetical protein